MQKTKKLIEGILNEVLGEIKPDSDYEKEIFKRINDIIKKINQNQRHIRAILGGSGAKGTWLKTFDADIFVLFDYKKNSSGSDKISDALEKILKKKFSNVVRLHGSRDYFQIKQSDFTFEIIPILKIQNSRQAKNITDVSPLHSKWVSKHKSILDEMKLAKQFCRAQNVYGAESYIRGLSGYVCEILTAHYGSFINLMKGASKWKEKKIIDVERHYRGKDVFKIINTSKLESPLIVIDPVQKERNAAAALSVEKFEAFRTSAGEFLNSPSKSFFENKDIEAIFLNHKSKNHKMVIVQACPQHGKIDVVGGRLLKIYEFLKKKAENYNFKIIKADWEWDRRNNSVFYFLFDAKPLERNFEVKGPPAKMIEHAEDFKKIHRSIFTRGSRIFATVERKFLNPDDFLRHLIKDEFVKERCAGITVHSDLSG